MLAEVLYSPKVRIPGLRTAACREKKSVDERVGMQGKETT